MSLKRAEEYLENKGFLDHVIELEESTATVAMDGCDGSRSTRCRAGNDR